MEKLKIGDKVVRQSNDRWSRNVYYSFSKVERLTKTQAVLTDGTKLVNEPKLDHWENKIMYSAFGDRWEKWVIETPEIIEEAKKEKERQQINRWFNDRKFNEEEIFIIYNTFKSLNKLSS